MTTNTTKLNIFARNIIIWVVLALFPLTAHSAISDFVSSENGQSKVRVIASTAQEGNKILLAVDFQLSSGWKIYAPDQFGFGQPPVFNWKNSNNIAIDKIKINWPQAKEVSEKIGSDVIKYSVYSKKALIQLELPLIDPSKNSDLNFTINYALCKEICIPAQADFNLQLTTGEVDQQALKLISTLQNNDDITVKDDNNKKGNLLPILLLAFIGGFILNIMPCVLPVLSIKLLSIIEHSRSSVRNIRIAYLATILGILFSFVILATLTSLVKILGHKIGWGLQFQSPYFLIALIIILMIFIANLLSMFEINSGMFLANKINKKIGQDQNRDKIFIVNFFSGILAVLLATPCSAPFLGTAISFALVAEIKIIFITFIFIGLGLALPYIILIAFPQMTNLMPKPGKWMVRVKQIMAGFLIATAVWLLYVLSHNIGFMSAMLVAFLASFLIFGFFKISGKIANHNWAKFFVFIAVIATIFALPISLSKHQENQAKNYDQIWIKFSAEQVPALVAAGKIVVIDITADWCLTCKVNKITVLDSKEVVQKLRHPQVVAMRGDLTKPDREIINFMASHNRYAIPFNIIYGPGAKNGILVSELLNQKAFLKTLAQASQAPETLN